MHRIALLLAVSLFLPAALPAVAADLPDGPWAQTCRDGALRADGSFAAICQDAKGGWRHTEIDVSDCRYVANRGGLLACSSDPDEDLRPVLARADAPLIATR